MQWHDQGMRTNRADADLRTPMSDNTILPLCDLRKDQPAVVADLVMPVRAEDRQLVLRLMELGFVPGEHLCIVAEALPGRDPLAVRIGQTTFALRRFEAAFILVTAPPRS